MCYGSVASERYSIVKEHEAELQTGFVPIMQHEQANGLPLPR
jgi:hypothetical protein